MIGLVLVTHGNLGAEFIKVTEHVVGKQDNLLAVHVESDGCADTCRKEIIESIDLVNNGEGVIVLTDMFGGTPSNLALSITDEKNIEVLAGVNIPMLIKLVTNRENIPVQQAVMEAKEAGRKYINVASELLKNGSK